MKDNVEPRLSPQDRSSHCSIGSMTSLNKNILPLYIILHSQFEATNRGREWEVEREGEKNEYALTVFSYAFYQKIHRRKEMRFWDMYLKLYLKNRFLHYFQLNWNGCNSHFKMYQKGVSWILGNWNKFQGLKVNICFIQLTIYNVTNSL